MRYKRIFTILAVLSILAFTTLATMHLLHKADYGFVCLQCNVTSVRNFERYTQQSQSELMRRDALNKTHLTDRPFIKDVRNDSNRMLLVNSSTKGTMIRVPTDCVKKNCREYLSKYEQRCMKACEMRVRKVEHYKGPINDGSCSFLPNSDRHPVALISAQGSGNTWTRGLLEKATGMCTGFIYCDTVMRVHGYVGESVKSGKVLVVKTHSPVPKWRGLNNKKSTKSDANYTSAVFILRNPMKAAVAEWNRMLAQEELGKKNSTVSLERHTYIVPKELFKGERWEGFLRSYMKSWNLRLHLWVIDQDKHPVHILRYEDLKKNTLKEIQKTLDFLNVSYNIETVEENLREDYSEFHRPHATADFEHYSWQQKQELRSALLEVIEAAQRAGKSHLLRLNEYLSTINTFDAD